jgi:hypothetical protein
VDVAFAPPDLRRLDELRADALVLPFFDDERPLRGSASLIDWRLRGQLSRLRLRGRLTGRAFERVLVPGRPLTGFDKVFLLGLGPPDAMNATHAEAACRAVFELLDQSLSRTAALVLPGRSSGVIEASAALEAFLRASQSPHEQDHVVVIEDGDTHHTLSLVVERERRKARAASPA